MRAFRGLPADNGRNDYNFTQRPAWNSADGCTVAFSYDHPLSPTAVETRRVDVVLR